MDSQPDGFPGEPPSQDGSGYIPDGAPPGVNDGMPPPPAMGPPQFSGMPMMGPPPPQMMSPQMMQPPGQMFQPPPPGQMMQQPPQPGPPQVMQTSNQMLSAPPGQMLQPLPGMHMPPLGMTQPPPTMQILPPSRPSGDCPPGEEDQPLPSLLTMHVEPPAGVTGVQQLQQQSQLQQQQQQQQQQQFELQQQQQLQQYELQQQQLSALQQQPPPQQQLQHHHQHHHSDKDQKLPHALEKALAFKTQRANELGVDGEVTVESEPTPEPPSRAILQSAFDDIEDYEDDDDKETRKKSAKDLRRKMKNKKKKKRNKSSKVQFQANSNENSEEPTHDDVDKDNKDGKEKKEKEKKEKDDHKISKNKKEVEKPDVEVEYIQERLNLFELDPMYRTFARVFDVFRIAENPSLADANKDIIAPTTLGAKREFTKVPKLPEEDDMEENQDKSEEKPRLSKRKLKKLTRLSIAELKQLVGRPDVVEMHDVTARDPKLLVQLKAHRNTVPVPRHWCFKRKYLQGKRGIEKPPFDLPDFIKKTGIMEMRSSLQDKEEQKTLKAKMRERARPKMGKIDIDYQKLHDAFFKWQTKPRLTIHGDLYYEGKEYETRLKEKKPGDLSPELRNALGMPVGINAHKVPPPWLIAMQRYGPPPSYPNLKIPGLNCPIPEGCAFGYHAGGWGKPPVDETGKPLYGDVFATSSGSSDSKLDEDEVDGGVWGELESDSEEESEEEEEEEGPEEPPKDESGLVTPSEGLVTPSGIASIPTGMETPDIIELRKKKIEQEMENSEQPALFQVLAEKRIERVGGSMMGSTHVYDMTGATGVPPPPAAPSISAPRRDTVELALDPSELDLDTDAMAARYEQQMREQQSHLQKEDLSDMLAEHVQRQKNKRKKQQAQDNKPTKKYKEFKF